MKAMLLREPDAIENTPLSLTDVPQAAPEAGQIRIKVSACGICHTDLHVVEGELPPRKLPLIPGHQIVGTIDAIGSNVGKHRIGDRVGVAWLYSTCGQCGYCLAGKENLCENARFTGYDFDGGYAEYAVVPQDYAYSIPEGFPDLQAAPLLCAGIIGYRALRLSEVEKGGRLALFGFGASAHLVLQIARYWDCEVFVFSRSEEHRKLALKLGAAWTGEAEQDPPAKAQSAIIFAPAGKLVLDALRILDRGGTLALAGIYMSPVPQLDYQRHLYHEKTIRSVSNSTREDAVGLLSLAKEIPLRAEIQEFRLDQANEALRLLKKGSIQGAGVLRVA